MPLTKSEREFLQKQFVELKSRLSALEDFINKQPVQDVESIDAELYEKLRSKRADFTNGNPQIPLYAICTNKCLEDMCKFKPLKIEDMKKINGIGEFKAVTYGQGFIDVIKEHIKYGYL